MKAYINSVDWADEGDVFFFSVVSEEVLEAMKGLTEVLIELDLLGPVEIYWGTNESFDFDPEDLLSLINDAEDISEEELAVFAKFKVSGFDIYENILDKLSETIYYYDEGGFITPENLTKEDMSKIKPFYVKIYGLRRWNEIEACFNKTR